MQIGDITVGLELPTASIPITLQRLVMEAGANRDFSLIHHDSQVARATGASGAFANTFFLMGMFERVMREWGLPKVTLQTMLRCPRRWGKTFVIAAFAAAYALAVPDKEIAIFATARRISVRLLDTIYAFICTVPGARDRVVSYNRGETPCIILAGDGPNDFRRIYAYPANHKISDPPPFLPLCLVLCAFLYAHRPLLCGGGPFLTGGSHHFTTWMDSSLMNTLLVITSPKLGLGTPLEPLSFHCVS